MFTICRAEERGETRTYWLDSKHTFNFGSFFEEVIPGCGPLKVINDDKVAPGKGFGMHGHDNMEIISFVVKGELAHKDSMGCSSILKKGYVQKISAGSGIEHSEYNPSSDNQVHFIQIWIEPHSQNMRPNYQEKNFTDVRKPGNMTLIVSEDGQNNSLQIHQNAKIYVVDLIENQKTEYRCVPAKTYWIQIVLGSVCVNGISLFVGDGIKIFEEEKLEFSAISDTEILLFELQE